MTDAFLIDECLSPDLVALAYSRGHNATHVVYRSLQGTEDHDLIPLILREGFVLVTNNARDFLKLFALEEIHPGLVIIVPGSLQAEEQVELFGKAIDAIEREDHLINKVVEVFRDGRVSIRNWPEEPV